MPFNWRAKISEGKTRLRDRSRHRGHDKSPAAGPAGPSGDASASASASAPPTTAVAGSGANSVRAEPSPAEALDARGTHGRDALTAGSSSAGQDTAAEQTASDPSDPSAGAADEGASAASDAQTVEQESLWDRAYKALDAKMVEDFDKVVNETVQEEATPDDAGKKAIQERIDEASRRGKTDYEAKKLQYKVFNEALVVSKVVRDAAKKINTFKPIIDEAVKASPAASFAWVGVSLALEIIASPHDVHEEVVNGLTKVTSAMHYYTEIEPLLLREKDGMGAGMYREIEACVADLYTHILDFQCRSVLRFYRSRLRRVGRDIVRAEDWKGMLAKVEAGEAELKDRLMPVLNLTANDAQRKVAERAEEMLLGVRLQLGEQTKTLKEMLDLKKEKELEKKVPLVPGAPYNSREDERYPQCQENTRVATLAKIHDWVDAPSDQSVFWLSGPAGFGKSTISRTLSRSLFKRGLLAASYFFRQPDRQQPDEVFSTIARQLMKSVEGFDIQLYEAMKTADSPVSALRLEDQCEALITKPLSRMRGHVSRARKVIVVDALDECDRKAVKTLCQLLCNIPKALPGRIVVFLTSRDVYPITSFFTNLGHRPYAHLDLQSKQDESVADITAFVTKNLEEAAEEFGDGAGPGSETLAQVISLCTEPSPLFIYASTLCYFVRSNGLRFDELKSWLDYGEGSQLSKLYESVLRYALFADNGKPKSKSHCDDALNIIGSVIFLSASLSISSLATLLGMDQSHVKFVLRDFRPVLKMPDRPTDPIQISHTSFIEFILDHKVAGLQDFKVSKASIHTLLARRCIVYMGENLKQDICRLQDPGKDMADVYDSIIDARIPSALKYACRFWVEHIQEAGVDDEVRMVSTFLEGHFLHWLEVMSLLRKFQDAMLAGRTLAWRAQDIWKADTSYNKFLQDITKFIDTYGCNIIQQHPLQAYGSALVFCPASSMVKNTQWKHRLSVIKSESSGEADGNLIPIPLEGHTRPIEGAAFSPDSKSLASWSQDRMVRLWSLESRLCTGVLDTKGAYVTSVAYSPDSKTLGTVSDCIRLWDSSDCQLKRSISLDEEDLERFLSVAFVPGSDDIAACMSDGTVRAWDYKTGDARYPHGTLGPDLPHPLNALLVASPDGGLLAACFQSTVLLLDAKTRSKIKEWRAVRGSVFGTGTARHVDVTGPPVVSISFGPDSQTITATTSSGAVWIWSTTTFSEVHQLSWGGFYPHLFTSRDGMMVVAKAGSRLSFWPVDELKSAKVTQVFQAKAKHVARVTFMDPKAKIMGFSPDNRQLVLLSRCTITLVDMTGFRNGADQGDRDRAPAIGAVRYARDGRTFVAATPGDSSVSVWDVGESKPRSRIPFAEDSVRRIDLSLDNKLLAVFVSSSDGLLPPQTVWLLRINLDAAEVVDKRTRLHISDEIDDAKGDHLNREPLSTAFSPDSKTLVIGFDDNVVRLWSTDTGAHTNTQYLYPDPACAAFSPDSEAPAVGFDGYSSSPQLFKTFTHVSNVAFSPDGRLLALSVNFFSVLRYLAVYEVYGDSLGPKPKYMFRAETPLFSLLFWPDGRHIDTDGGLVDLDAPSLDMGDGRDRLPGRLYIDRGWVVRDGRRILWLPSKGSGLGKSSVFERDGLIALSRITDGGGSVVVELAPPVKTDMT